MTKLPFCHLKITDLSFEEWMDVVDNAIKERTHLSISRLSLKTFVRSIFNKKLKHALNSMDILVPRGRFLYRLVKKTYPDYKFELDNSRDMITPLIREYHPFRVNFVLLGGSLQGLNRLSINLKASFPELKIIGTYPRFFLEQKPEDIKTIIRKSEPHVFFVGIGEGDDEIWIEENRELIPKTVAIGVNKQIEIMCHDIPDIPFRYKANNREFVYRLKRKPYRIFDLFIWVFVWGRWRWFLYKLKKTRKGAQI